MKNDWDWIIKNDNRMKGSYIMNYGEFGGQYVPQELLKTLEKISSEFEKCKNDETFINEYRYYLKNFVGRPTPLYYAENLTKHCQGAKIYLKREDLNHTGAHKINNALGQVLLAKRMNKTHIIAETGAGQHGVAVATVCALFDIKCTIFMGREDIKRQKVNVEKMKLYQTIFIIVNKLLINPYFKKCFLLKEKSEN